MDSIEEPVSFEEMWRTQFYESLFSFYVKHMKEI